MAKILTLEEILQLPKPTTPVLFMGMDLTRPDPVEVHYRTRMADLWDAILNLVPNLPPDPNCGPWEAWTYGRDEIRLVADYYGSSPSRDRRESQLSLSLFVLSKESDTRSTVQLAPNVQEPPDYIVLLFTQLDTLFEQVT